VNRWEKTLFNFFMRLDAFGFASTSKMSTTLQKKLAFKVFFDYFIYVHTEPIFSYFDYFKYVQIKMVFTDPTRDFFLVVQSKVRAALAASRSETPFAYDGEPFFAAYEALYRVWVKRQSQREVAEAFSVSRTTLKEWEENFVAHGAIGLLPSLSFVDIDSRLERLVVLVKAARPHENSSLALRLANALQLSDATLDHIRLIQRCYGYGQRLDENDVRFFAGLQHLLTAVAYHKAAKKTFGHDCQRRAETFIDYDQDSFQQKIELFKTLAGCEKKRQLRPILQQFGVHPNRYYELKNRYLVYGVWGLVDLVQTTRIGEKISPELELKIIEERLMDPSLSAEKMIEKLELKCSRANVLKIYARWQLSTFGKPIAIRGVVSTPVPPGDEEPSPIERSACSRFPNLIQTASLKVDRAFENFLGYLSHHRVPVSNPGAIILAPFLEQLGVIEALHTYGPETYRTNEMTNNIIVNVLRIIVGFPTIHDFTLNSDRSVAIGAGFMGTPRKSRFYESFDDLRFHHLQKLRNDAARRAKELGIIEGKEMAIDYHCDPSDSRFPHDKMLSKSPDKNGDLVYAHRPQIIWDSITHSIVNIAYCEGRSRAPSALYKFCEENLFKIIDPVAIAEIYADSEYTGEKQLIYLMTHHTQVTMCLKQNKKIKRWKEETLKTADWQPYHEKYRLASRDYVLPETGKPFRFVVKQDLETNDTRCFGSTHVDFSPAKIIDAYHLRWPVETGIKDLIENYFLNKPTGTSPEKIEVHYYCVMLARLVIDYFLAVLGEPQWKTPEEWECVLSTIRTTLFTNQNCELTRHESGDLELIYLDGDPLGIKAHLKSMLDRRLASSLNRVPWWGNRGVRIKIEDRFNLGSGSQNA
jgi:hypothetical protein